MLDFMEKTGDLSRPLPGAQGRLRAEHLWNELNELLNSVGGSGVQKQADKWKRVPLSSEPIMRTPSPQPNQASSLPAVQEASMRQQVELPHTPDPQPLSNTGTLNVASNSRRQEEVIRSPSAGPSTPRGRRVAVQRRRRHQTPFEQATSEFVYVENGRLRLEEMRIMKQHEQEMEQLRVESRRIVMDENHNKIFQRIADIATNVMELLSQSRLVRD